MDESGIKDLEDHSLFVKVQDETLRALLQHSHCTVLKVKTQRVHTSIACLVNRQSNTAYIRTATSLILKCRQFYFVGERVGRRFVFKFSNMVFRSV